MSKPKNAVWRFFASVKLALIVLIILATTSIIGTLIKQGQDHAKYVEEYGTGLTGVLEALELTNMYSSWWYIALLFFFAVNLTVCSIERLPRVWRIVVMNNLDIDPAQLDKKNISNSFKSNLSIEAAEHKVLEALKTAGWKNTERLSKENSTLLFVQKGAWTRLGVYVVHLSILVVLLGAIIGNLFGYQAYVFIPEGTTTENIYLRKNKEAIPLDFKLKCEKFEKVYYPNGMTKQYRVDLSIHDPELATPYEKSVIVNDPLSYKGLTFYVGDSFPLQEYLFVIQNHTNNSGQAFRVGPDVDVQWQGTDVTFRLENLQLDQDGNLSSATALFNSGTSSQPSKLQIGNEGTIEFKQSGVDYSIYLRQYQSVLLLIAKDPGVLTVYLGSALMVIGLLICLLLSHRRIWVHLSPTSKQRTQILISGDTNKNKASLAQQLEKLTEQLNQSLSDTTIKKTKRN